MTASNGTSLNGKANSTTNTYDYVGANLFSTPSVKTEMSVDIGSLATALSKFQGELETSKKDNAGYGYNYSDLASVIGTAKPGLAKNGLAVIQLVGETTETHVNVVTLLTHSSGQWLKSNASLPIIEMKGCNKAQGAGASLSYLRRYAYQAITGMASEDNDASSEGFNKGGAKPSQRAAVVAETKANETTTVKAAGTPAKSTSFRRTTAAATPAKATTAKTGADDDI